jgi:ammonia channel protein AmtB
MTATLSPTVDGCELYYYPRRVIIAHLVVLRCSDGNWIQLGKQVAWICVGVTWTFVVTYAIMFVINLVPGLHFRASEEAEVVGMDVSHALLLRSSYPGVFN